MDVLSLSRLQFAVTAAFHFIFPALSIGIAWLNVIFLGKYLKSGSREDESLADFWINLFIITFVAGVATGIVMVFQFGTNWNDYSRYVGDIFGAPLAAEAILAFFLEATFIGVLVWGKKRVSKGFYFFSSIMVACGATLSAFWIIAANSWQQTPAGYTLTSGRPILTDFMAALFNPSTLPRYFHTVDACLIAGALFVLGLSAWYLLRNDTLHRVFALKSIKIALITLLLASLAQVGLGHWHAVQVANTQPAKLAAFEGLFESEAGAPLLLFGIPDESNAQVKHFIGIPKLLSLVVYGDANATVSGLNEFPRSEWPPVSLSFYPFHIMVILGGYFLLLSLAGIILLYSKRGQFSKWFLKLSLYSIPLGVIAAELGWMCAEVGRQPWVVYGLLRTDQAVSYNVPAVQVLLSILIFVVLFTLLFCAFVYLVKKKLVQGPVSTDGEIIDSNEGVA